MSIQNTIKEDMKISGKITFTNFILSCKEAIDIDFLLSQSREIPLTKEVYQKMIARLNEICETKEAIFYNQVHLSGREVFARIIAGDNTYTGEINYGALGTGSGAINDADTTLGTEVARKGTATALRSTDTVTVDFYYSKNDTDGTYNEFGTFIDGTSSADSGQMYNRVLTGGWTKSSTEAMTVSQQIDINNG